MHRTRYILILDLILLALCAAGVYRVALKARFPVQIEAGKAVIIDTAEAHSQILADDSLITVAGQTVHSNNELEFLCNEHFIGELVPVQLSRNGKLLTLSIPLVPDYSLAVIIIESVIALIFFLVGIAVVLLQKKEKTARIFHHLCVSISALILLTSGRYTISPFGLGYIIELFFEASYTFVPVLFFHFTIVFSSKQLHGGKIILSLLYASALGITIWTAIAFLHASYPAVDLNNYGAYRAAYRTILIFFIVVFFAGFWNIIRSYRISKEDFEKRKFLWIFFGIVFGTCPYIFLSLIPTLFSSKGLVSEALSISFSVIAPLSFGIAIVRYRIFDITVLFKRSTVYAIVLGALLAVYLGIVGLLSYAARSYGLSSSIADITAALLIALLFEPLRKQVQKIVDKKFFRVSYNFYEAHLGFQEEIKFVRSKISLANLITERIQNLLPVAKIGFFVVEAPSERLRLLAHYNFDILERRQVQLETKDLKTGLELPVAREDKIEPGIRYESADPAVFRRWGMALVLPLLSSSHQILGFLVLGEKLSGARFSVEDISLLVSISTQCGLALERLKVEYSLMLEQAESERLAELSKLKSYFVSSVSHDLKTPLTSIRLFAEIMKEQENLPRTKAKEYLEIIEGEADRLSRLITNVLDFAKIEKGTKEYSFKSIDLNGLTRDVLHSLEYQIHSRGFTENMIFSTGSLVVSADKDAVFDVITNLITNAMKYSPAERKHITVRTEQHVGFAVISVQDEGYGIAESEREHIFESFYRIDHPEMKAAGGAGLGLSLVKHTMDAHHGKVEVTSEIGKGSIFVLYFPTQSL